MTQTKPETSFTTSLPKRLTVRSVSVQTKQGVMTCVRNRCLNVMRSRSVREQAMMLYPLDEEQQALDDDEQHIKALLDGIERLAPPICRGIVLMHYRDGLTFKQIAAHYHVSETTIYKHLRDAMSQLRLTLKQLG